MTGWIRFTTKGERGTKPRFKFGEMLNDTGAADRANDGPAEASTPTISARRKPHSTTR